MSARAGAAAQLNTGHHLSTRVPCHPVWPRPVACSQGTNPVPLHPVWPRPVARFWGPINRRDVQSRRRSGETNLRTGSNVSFSLHYVRFSLLFELSYGGADVISRETCVAVAD